MLLAAAFFHSASSQDAEPVTLPCHLATDNAGDYPFELPDTHYLYTERYGWFDTSHFRSGDPEDVLADVRAAGEAGGGLVTIRQGIHENVFGYTGAYHVAGGLSADELTAAALGIYLDWSLRFEAWQAEPPQGLIGPTSPFAAEDLPSQYLGFAGAVYDVPLARLFACYLGPVTGSNDGPPDIVAATETAEADGWAGLTRLDNQTFQPLVETEDGWRTVEWPAPLQMRPLDEGPDTWRFVAETTWYLGDTDEDHRMTAFYRSGNRHRPAR